MALTQTYMRQLVRSRLDDADFEDEYLDQALNEAQWDILRNLNLTILEKSSTVTLSNGTNSVPFPTDMQAGGLIGARAIAAGIQSYDITENFVDYATFQENISNSLTTASSVPLWWTTFASNMIFPANADKDYTITVDYLQTVPKVDGTTVTTFLIPEEYQELLKIGAYMRIAKREDDYDVKQQEMQDYERMKLDLIKTYSRNRGPRKKHIMRMGR